MADIHPVGLFPAHIADHSFVTAKTGNPQFVVKYETSLSDGSTQQITGYFAMTDKAIEYTIEKIRNMGYQGSDLADLADGSALAGKKCTIEIKHEYDQQQQLRARVSFVHPDGYSPELKRDADAAANVRRFNALLKKAKPVAATTGSATTADSGEVEEPPFH